MKVRNKNENTWYKNHIESAIDELEQAIDTISYISYPDINKRTIEKLKDAIKIMDDALDACIFKP